MALLAGRGETGMRHRRRRVVVIRLMATHARRARDVVVVIDVTVGTLPRRDRMRPRQRKSRLRMIEARGLPGRRVVAHLAGLRESPSHVIRIRCALKIFQVARDAGRARQVVIVIDMAIRTLPRRNGVRARQSKIHERVIESRGLPRHGRMALRAIRREIGSYVIRIRRALEIL